MCLLQQMLLLSIYRLSVHVYIAHSATIFFDAHFN